MHYRFAVRKLIKLKEINYVHSYASGIKTMHFKVNLLDAAA